MTATTSVVGHHLTALDQAFLQMERPGLPMHVASVATFDGGPLLDEHGALRVDALARHIEQRAALLPRLRQRVWSPPAAFEHDRWVDDPDFDVRHHLDVVALPPPGDEATLQALAAEIGQDLLDRAHPLWHIRVVTGLEGGRIALVQRTHHAMVDGVSGVDVAAVLLDLEPHPAGDVAPPPWAPSVPPTVTDEVLELAERWRRAPADAFGTVTAAISHPDDGLRRARSLLDGLRAAVGDGLVAPPCSLNVPVGERRRLAWVRTRLDELKAIGRRHGATVNDVVLTAIAGGVRAQLVGRGEPLPSDRTLKVLVPVSLRRTDERGALGNRVAAYLLPLPIGIGDPANRLRTTAEAMSRLKAHHEESVSDLLLGLADGIPVGVAAAVARTVDVQRFVNLVVTNVPGPRQPLYLLGARMLEAFPVVPLGGNLSAGVAILSYGDALNIGLHADPEACPDLDVLVRGIERSLAELASC